MDVYNTHVIIHTCTFFIYKTLNTHTHMELYIYTGCITNLHLTYQVLVLSNSL